MSLYATAATGIAISDLKKCCLRKLYTKFHVGASPN